MGTAVNNYDTGVIGRADVGPLLKSGVPGRIDLWIRDMGGNHIWVFKWGSRWNYQ